MRQIRLLLSPSIFLSTIGLLFGGAAAILAGESVEWVRNGFLVKILARDGPAGEVESCTGSLVSTSLVLTSGHCVLDRATKKTLSELVVFVPKSGRKSNASAEFRSTAKLVATSGGENDDSGGWALLRIIPQNITELCPPSPAPKWISRLNFRPSLLGPSRIEVDPAELASTGASCHLVGFATTEEAEGFLTESTVFRLFLEQLAKPLIDDPLQHYRSRVYHNFTACYDDAGAPLMCRLPSLGDYELQLGLFQSLSTPESVMKGENGEEGITKCQKAHEMRFTLFAQDPKLAEAIQRHSMAEFVEVYQKCQFSS